MAEENIKRYSKQEIQAKIAAGDYMPTRADAPELELEDDFWDKAELASATSEGSTAIVLQLDAETLSFFKKDGRNPGDGMAEVLRAYVEAKKAS